MLHIRSLPYLLQLLLTSLSILNNFYRQHQLIQPHATDPVRVGTPVQVPRQVLSWGVVSVKLISMTGLTKNGRLLTTRNEF